jgi:general secretion pathway protein A
MNPSTEYNLERQLKLLWGATAMPFGKTVRAPFRWPGFDQAHRRLQQSIALRASGVLTAPNGTGKSFLLSHCLGQLSDKQYALIHLHHTSLTGSDILRSLCYLLGQKPRFRRSDTIELIGQSWGKLEGRFPLLVVDEAQNLAATALEEIRLLGCAHLDARPLFGLILAGDEDLLPRLRLGINRSLLTRLGFCIALEPIGPDHAAGYIRTRLREVAMPEDAIEPAACQLLWQAGDGALRTINLLAREAIQNAAEEQAEKIGPAHVQQAIEQLPWFAPTLAGR